MNAPSNATGWQPTGGMHPIDFAYYTLAYEAADAIVEIASTFGDLLKGDQPVSPAVLQMIQRRIFDLAVGGASALGEKEDPPAVIRARLFPDLSPVAA